MQHEYVVNLREQFDYRTFSLKETHLQFGDEHSLWAKSLFTIEKQIVIVTREGKFLFRRRGSPLNKLCPGPIETSRNASIFPNRVEILNFYHGFD